MDRKRYSCFLSWIIYFNVFACVLPVNGMQDLENIKEEFRPLADAELPQQASSISKEKGEKLKKGIAEAKNIAIETIIRKNIEDGKKDLKPTGEVYLYNPETGKGSIFEAVMSTTLKGIFKDLQNNTSLAAPSSSIYSGDIIKILHDILKEYQEKLASKDRSEYDEIVTEIIRKKFDKSVDVAELVSVFALAEYLDIDKTVYKALLNQLKQKINVILGGSGMFTDNDKAILNSIDRNLLKIIVGDKWDVFIEKIEIILVKKSFNDEKEKYSYKINRSSNNMHDISYISDMSFSPDDKFLYMRADHDARSGFTFIDGCLITNTENKQTKNMLTPQAQADYTVFGNSSWIEKHTICYAYLYSKNDKILNLYFYDCMLQKSTIEQLSLPTDEDLDELRIKSILGAKDEIIFFYSMSRGNPLQQNSNFKHLGHGIAIFDYKSKEVTYHSLEAISKDNLWPVNIVSQSRKTVKFVCRGEQKILYEFDYEIKNLVKLKEFDKDAHLVFTRDGEKIAISLFGRTSLYFFNTKTEIQCSSVNKGSNQLVFSSDGKVFMSVEPYTIVFFSAITGEKIGEFIANNGLCFEHNIALFSPNDNRLAICQRSDWKRDTSTDLPTDLSLLIIDRIPKKYISLFDYLKNNKFSFDQIVALIALQNQSDNGKKPLQLTDEEKATFNEIQNNELRKLLIDIGYVKKTQPPKEAGREMLKTGRSYLDWLKALKANFSWDSLMKYLPGSG